MSAQTVSSRTDKLKRLTDAAIPLLKCDYADYTDGAEPGVDSSSVPHFVGPKSKTAPIRLRGYRRYSDEDLLTLRDELRLLWEYDAKRKTEMDGLLVGPVVGQRAERLARIVAKAAPQPAQKVICDYWLRKERQPVEAEWTKEAKKIKPRPQCLPAVLAWGCVHYAGHLKFCANPDCKDPYFISKRRDQKYCRDECAAPAKREAKRRWWSANRSKLANMKKEGRSPQPNEHNSVGGLAQLNAVEK